MTRMIRGSVLLAACVGLWSCSNGDTVNSEAGVPYQIRALPSVVIVKQDSAQLIAFELVDQLDGQIPEQWTITATSPNFTVAVDSTYRPVYNTDGTLTLPDSQTQIRATITGTALGNAEFTASAGGKSITIPVSVVPGVLNALFTPANPAPGDTVTVTLPPSLRFTPTSAVFFPGNDSVIVVSRAADSTSIRFISAPSTDTTATMTKIFNVDLPTVTPVTLISTTKLTGSQSALLPNKQGPLPITMSNLNPDLTPITGTLVPQLAFTDSTVFSFPDNANPVGPVVSADSSTVTLGVQPNVNGPLRATKFIFRGAPQFKFAATAGVAVVSSIVVPNVPATIIPASPTWGDTITVTVSGGFKLSPTSTVTWGANGLYPAQTVSMATDSLSMKVLPIPGSTGLATISFVLNAATYPGAAISLPTTGSMALLTHSATTDPATAPTLIVPGYYYDDGHSIQTVCLAGGNTCSFYKIVVPDGDRTFTFQWPQTFSSTGANNTTDMGMYFLNSTLTDFAGGDLYGCDAHGSGASAQPETCTQTFTAGTYYIEADKYSTNPQPVSLSIEIQ